MSFLKNLFKKKSKQQPIKKADTKPVLPDFVERYTLVNPKNILGGPELWALSPEMPIPYENDKNTSGRMECAKLHTSVMLPFMRDLKRTPNEFIEPGHMRTVSVVHLNNGLHIYVLPVLPMTQMAKISKNGHKPSCYVALADDNDTNCKRLEDKPGWSFFMNPEIRKAIVEEIKLHTRVEKR